MVSLAIDLNSDVGEGAGDDAAILAVVSSANVACGGHAGDAESMTRTVAMAREHGVRVGAHVSYPDRAGFGRREIEIAPVALARSLTAQLAALSAISRRQGMPIHYVKPHGALYNRIARDAPLAELVVAEIKRFDPQLALLTLPGSDAMSAARAARLVVFAEGYADRAYTGEGRLVGRGEAGAVLSDDAAVVYRAVRLAVAGTVMSIDGRSVRVDPRSLCIHGDTPGAARLSAQIRQGLEAAGVTIASFAPTDAGRDPQ